MRNLFIIGKQHLGRRPDHAVDPNHVGRIIGHGAHTGVALTR